ncbi:MAG: [protein-PII] uridylyltransferase [bacterium]
MANLEDIKRFYLKGREWLQKRHEEGITGGEYGQAHADLIDRVLRSLFKIAFQNEQLEENITCLARGSYGREELSPYSDIDLLILHGPGKGKRIEEWVRRMLYPLWDWGLTLGYTIQTPQESWRASGKDLDLFLSFLDARWVAGEKKVFYEWERKLWEVEARGREQDLILKIQQKIKDRHQHYGDSVFILEPEIKEGKGGLRDYHAAWWAAKIKYRLSTNRELTENKILSEKEWHILWSALNFLWRVRNQLHYFYQRREDRLSFEDQERIASLLGYREPEMVKATELFLQDYFRHALHIYQISTHLIDRCLNEQTVALSGYRGPASAEIFPGFSIYHGKLIATDSSLFDRQPLAIWKAFAIVHEYGVEMDSQLKELIAGQLDVVGEKFRSAEESIKSFWSFFAASGNLSLVLETMHETGFLQKFLPEFEKIHCQVQYDRYHIYPVDIHSIYAVRELENLEKGISGQSYPLFCQIMGEIEEPGLLKLAVFLHDLGKGEGAAHARRGEDIAAAIGQRLNLSPEQIARLRFLVREHQTFAEIAQRRDLNEENLILRFAQKVEDEEKLRMLYLLSFADLRAVGPNTWNVWKDTLLRELFFKTLHILEKGEIFRKDDQELIEEKQNAVMDLLNGQIPPWKVSQYLVNIPWKQFAWLEPQAIARYILMADKLSDQIVVLEGEERLEQGWAEITVVAQDEPGLFAKICGVLTANSLNILSAQINTWENGVAVDIFQVQNLIPENLFSFPRWSKIQEELKEVLEKKRAVEELLARFSLPLFHQFYSSRQSARVEIDNETSDFYTIIEIFASDRPGLLYQIAQKFYTLGLNIWSAKVSTKVDQVVDVFYIQDGSGAKITEEKKFMKIKEEILNELGKGAINFCPS